MAEYIKLKEFTCCTSSRFGLTFNFENFYFQSSVVMCVCVVVCSLKNQGKGWIIPPNPNISISIHSNIE